MNDNLVIYTIQPQDTLASIAQRYGMAADELRDFHNENCRRVGLLWLGGLTGIQQIVVPDNFKSAAEIVREQAQILPSKEMSTYFFAEEYAVTESYESDMKTEVEVDYTVAISIRLDNKAEEHNWIASVNCFDFLKEGSTPDDKMSEISLSCSQSIGPLSFVLSKHGKMLGSYQFESLLKTFRQKRADLEDFFVGEIYSKFLDKFAESLSNQEYFEKQIRSALLYQVLFFGLDAFHRSVAWQQDFCMVKNSFPLNCDFKRTVMHLDDHRVQTVFRGEAAERVSLQSLLLGKRITEVSEEALTGLIELKYTTHKITKRLLEAETGIALFDGEELYRKQKIKLLTI